MRPVALFTALLFLACAAAPARAIDPPYEAQMERLAQILGSLYFLQPLCEPVAVDWRTQMADLITLDEPDDDRRQRLTGAFNGGYADFARLYRTCTSSAQAALRRLLGEAETIARDIHSHYAE